MSATSANRLINNQVGSADAESEDTVVGGDDVRLGDDARLGDGEGLGDGERLGDGLAARTRSLKVLDGPYAKLAIRTPSMTTPSPCPPQTPMPRVQIGLSVLPYS
jgi:hypothetical protein